jgi:hypothetical protein
MNELTKKWEPTGLLENVDKKYKDKVACRLEKIARILVTNIPDKDTPEYNKYEELCGYIVLITRRLFEKLYPRRYLQGKELIDDFKKYLEENRHLLKDLNSYIALDGEIEFVDLYCTKKAEQCKNNNIEVDLLTEEEVKKLGEKYGFTYEPDESKCKTINAGSIYTTYNWDGTGTIKVSPPMWEYDSIAGGHFNITKEEWMEGVCLRNYFKFVHIFRVFHPKDGDVTDLRGFYHGHSRVHIVGHTKMTPEEVNEIKKKYESICKN